MLGAGHDLLNSAHSQEGISYKLAPAIGPCHLHLYGLIHVLLQLLIFNTLERSSGWRAEMRRSVLEGKTGRTGLQRVRYSQELILWAQFLYLLISRKALHGDICSSWLAETCKKKKKVLDCMYFPFTRIPYILAFPLASLEQFLRALWYAVSWAIVLILPHIKFDSQLSSCAFF